MGVSRRLAGLVLLLVVNGCQSAKPPEQPTNAQTPEHTQPATPSTPSESVTPQSIVKDLFPHAPEKAATADCFHSLKPEMSVYAVVQKCGRPDEDVGSGVYVFVYHLQDGSTVGIGTPYMTRVDYLTITDSRGSVYRIIEAGRLTTQASKAANQH